VYCTGNVAHTCAYDDHGLVCGDADCGQRHCVEIDDGGNADVLCALDAEPRPICGSENEDFIACDGAVRTHCRLGYAIDTMDCGDAALCESRAGTCLARPGEDTVCAAQDASGNSIGYCDGSYSLRCDGPYVIGAWNCGTAQLCHVGPLGYTGCILSTTPDARCPTPSVGTGFSIVCDGVFAISCFDGYDHAIVDCTSPDADDTCSSCP
jgi:hypothetical protein